MYSNRPMARSWNQGIFDISSTQKEILGQLRHTPDGRKFRYSKAGASALAAGKVGVAPAAVANHINKNVAVAVAIGDKEVQVTVGATAVTADQYKDGFLQVNDGTGEGHQYPIESNTACDASGTTVVKLQDHVKVALVTGGTSEVSLIYNPWTGVTESTTEENVPVGIAPVAVTAAYYYWAQTGGPAIALIAGTPAVGTMLTLSATAGALAAINGTLDIDQPYFAQMLATAGVATEYKPVKLMID